MFVIMINSRKLNIEIRSVFLQSERNTFWHGTKDETKAVIRQTHNGSSAAWAAEA